jgi:hypothetical protein
MLLSVNSPIDDPIKSPPVSELLIARTRLDRRARDIDIVFIDVFTMSTLALSVRGPPSKHALYLGCLKFHLATSVGFSDAIRLAATALSPSAPTRECLIVR